MHFLSLQYLVGLGKVLEETTQWICPNPWKQKESGKLQQVYLSVNNGQHSS